MPDLDDLEALSAFRRDLATWFRQHRRDLVWRRVRDPYAILVAEVFLQQTRVEQARGYYARFMAAFPDLATLARASEEDVLHVWAGAGYYRRARDLHRLAQAVAETGLPTTAAELEELPGIGPYTAAAVASIAYGEPVAAVDGNVRRVLARLFAVEEPGGRWLQKVAEGLLDREDPGTWNQAVMELGSLVCTPKHPSCATCPVAGFCRGWREAERYPAPRQRAQRRVEAVALVLRGEEGLVLEKRDGQSLGGLWGFPLAEGEGALEVLLSRYGLASARPLGTVEHVFTHKRLTIEVYVASWPGPVEDPGSRPLSVLDRKILALAGSSIGHEDQ
ncbi:MAG: A/G-specific adenine glycosylase MutY [Candidatus Bipolaricaulota bacterium]|nr:A/G-specific adenine glycosylase [Candidatus Bipolaricaulota bacterium]